MREEKSIAELAFDLKNISRNIAAEDEATTKAWEDWWNRINRQREERRKTLTNPATPGSHTQQAGGANE